MYEKIAHIKVRSSVVFILLIVTMLACLFLQRSAVLDNAKGLAQIIPLCVFVLGGFLLAQIRQAKVTAPIILEGGALFCGICFYMTGLFLFLKLQPSKVLESGLVFVALLMLIVVYTNKSFLAVLFYEIACGIFIVSSTMQEKRFVFLFMLVFLIPYAIEMYKLEQNRYHRLLFEAGTALIGVLFFMITMENVAFGIWFFNIYAYFLTVLLLHYKFYPVKTPYYASPMKLVGVTGILMVWGIGAFAQQWENGIVPGADWIINIEFFVLLLAICVFLADNLLRGRFNVEQMLLYCGYYVSFFVYVVFEFYFPQQMGYIHIYFTILTTLACLYGLHLALRRRDQKLFSVWLGAFVIWISSFFISNEYLLHGAVAASLLGLFASTVMAFYKQRTTGKL